MDIDPLLADELWRRGELAWLLRDYQHEFYDHVWAFLRKEAAKLGRLAGTAAAEAWRKLFEDCHRRYGKSFVLFLIGTEIGRGKACRDWPRDRRVIRFAAPTMLDLEEIYHPIAEDLFETCPDDIRPVWRSTRGRGHYYFPGTGSALHLFGVDAKHYRKGRGKRLHLGVVDEAGTCEPGCPDGIEHVVNSILLPQTFGIDGCVVIATTPSETPGHPSASLKAQCEATGAYFKRTILDTAHHFGPDVVDEYAREYGGRETTRFLREYMCEWVTEEARAICPEYTEKLDREIAALPTPPPTHEQPVVSMDPAFEDGHGILFGYYSFATAKAIIEDEALLWRKTTDKVAECIFAKEKELWGKLGLRTPNRYSDTDKRLIADLSELHGLHFSATAKDHKEAQVNQMRMLVASKRLWIHPRCVNLRRQLRIGVWNEQRSQFERTAQDGHFDLVDALIYFLRNCNVYENPYPKLPPEVTSLTHHIPRHLAQPQRSVAGSAVASLFKGRRA